MSVMREPWQDERNSAPSAQRSTP